MREFHQIYDFAAVGDTD